MPGDYENLVAIIFVLKSEQLPKETVAKQIIAPIIQSKIDNQVGKF